MSREPKTVPMQMEPIQTEAQGWALLHIYLAGGWDTKGDANKARTQAEYMMLWPSSALNDCGRLLQWLAEHVKAREPKP